MNGHHLILGQLTDFISGDTLDDTLDERHRQKISRFLVERKRYLKQDITPRHELTFEVEGKCARMTVSYEIAASAVSEPAIDTQLVIQPAGKPAPQNGVYHLHRDIIRIAACDAKSTDHEPGFGGVAFIYQQ